MILRAEEKKKKQKVDETTPRLLLTIKFVNGMFSVVVILCCGAEEVRAFTKNPRKMCGIDDDAAGEVILKCKY